MQSASGNWKPLTFSLSVALTRPVRPRWLMTAWGVNAAFPSTLGCYRSGCDMLAAASWHLTLHSVVSQRAMPAKYHTAQQELQHLNLHPEIRKMPSGQILKWIQKFLTLHTRTVLLHYNFIYAHAHVCAPAHKGTEIMQPVSVHVGKKNITAMQVRKKNDRGSSCLRRSRRGYHHLTLRDYSIHLVKGRKIKASHSVLLSHK